MSPPPAKFHYGDVVSWTWPGSSVECSGKIVASDETGITAMDEQGREYPNIPHGSFYKPGEQPGATEDDDPEE